jgi:hypothetical protein
MIKDTKGTIQKNPFVFLLPFMFLYVVIILMKQNPQLLGDETRYVMFTKNLMHGFYSPPAPHINLMNGPGYPLLLLPFMALKIPFIWAKLLNAIFQYLALVFLYKSISLKVNPKYALGFTIFLGFCYSSYYYLTVLLTESLSLFLISTFVYLFLKGSIYKSPKLFIVAGLVLGFLGLVKVIFGYVLIVIFVLTLSNWLIQKKRQHLKIRILIPVAGLLIMLPYIVYTYNLTGRIFSWGSVGASNLYWMSTPERYEYGGWNNDAFTANPEGPEKEMGTVLLKKYHQFDYQLAESRNGLEQGDVLKDIAKKNILNHPTKYLKNWFSNLHRLFFGFPGNYTFEVPLTKIWYFAIVFVMLAYGSILTILSWRRIKSEIWFLMLFAMVYFAGSTLVSALNRQLIIMLPLLFVWIACIMEKTIYIRPFIQTANTEKSGKLLHEKLK